MRRTRFADRTNRGEIFTVYGNGVSTNAAIADAKIAYQERHGIDKSRLTARKFGQGFDKKRQTVWKEIIVAPSYGERR